MKRRVSTRNSCLTALALLGVFAPLGPVADAQVNKAPGQLEDPGKSAAGAPAQYALEIADGKMVLPATQAGKEAKLKTVVDALRDKYPQANIVVSPDVAEVAIGDLKLRALSLPQELEALRVASGNQFAWQSANGPNSGAINASTGLPTPESYVGLYTLFKPEVTPDNQRTVEAFNLTPYLEQHKEVDGKSKGLAMVQDIVSRAVQALDRGNSPAAEYQFHPGANILVVIGTSQQLDVARKVVGALIAPESPGGVLNSYQLTDIINKLMARDPQWNAADLQKTLTLLRSMAQSDDSAPAGVPPGAPALAPH